VPRKGAFCADLGKFIFDYFGFRAAGPCAIPGSTV
jgi:hypothetical protein